jgi:hypothetical protein
MSLSPGALRLLIRARVIEIEREALAGAKPQETCGFGKPAETDGFRNSTETLGFRPRPILVLPSNSRFARRLMRGLIYRPH